MGCYKQKIISLVVVCSVKLESHTINTFFLVRLLEINGICPFDQWKTNREDFPGGHANLQQIFILKKSGNRDVDKMNLLLYLLLLPLSKTARFN